MSRQHPDPQQRRHLPPRPTLHPAVTGSDPQADAVALKLARSLVRVGSRSEAAALLCAAVAELGGVVVAAAQAPPHALQIDVSLGVGHPLVVVPREGRDTSGLELVLTALVEDARAAAARCDRHAHQARRASVDDLTGVANRREILPRLKGARPGDAVAIIDLDHFKNVNDQHGHAAGDEALRALGSLLLRGMRTSDFVGRYGGDEFVVVMASADLSVAVRRLRELSRTWLLEDDDRPSLSAGVALVDEGGGAAALSRADRALYDAKASGRNRIEAEQPA